MNYYAENCVAITVPRAEEVTRSLSVEGFWCQDRHHFICKTRVFSTALFPSIATMSVISALPWFNLHMVFVRLHTYLRVCMCWAR